eukprot:Em0014g717a
MWHNHMTLHAKAAPSWLQIPDMLLTCTNAPRGALLQSPYSSLFPSPVQMLAKIFLHLTRPAFARALSSSLRDVLQKNTEDAWLKLFMLPKCVLLSLTHKGNHNPHKSIESLCNMLLNNDLTTLWMMAKSEKLIALDKSKEGSPPDVRPIAVGETLRRLTGKCICTILRNKFSSFFDPSQFGVACKAGAEKIVHSVRRCIEDNWLNGDFVVFKVDMLNGFNMVSKQAVLDECATFFPELLPWVSWCYGSHSSLWHPMGRVSSQSGVQQGDPLGPMLLALVLHKLVTSIEVDDDCLHLILEAWYLDDGVLAGERSAVIRALHLIEELGPHLGLHINFSKCELFRNGNSHFPPVESSLLPNLDILGVPIGDFVHCSRFIAEKCAPPKTLLKALVDVSAVDLHVAFSILRMCGSYCKLVHLARATPPSHCAD